MRESLTQIKSTSDAGPVAAALRNARVNYGSQPDPSGEPTAARENGDQSARTAGHGEPHDDLIAAFVRPDSGDTESAAVQVSNGDQANSGTPEDRAVDKEIFDDLFPELVRAEPGSEASAAMDVSDLDHANSGVSDARAPDEELFDDLIAEFIWADSRGK